MGAVRLKTLADLRRRRLQAIGIGTILLLATAAGTLALSILVESHAPFERAFAAANGAHLVIHYRGDIPAADLSATAHASVVTASAGPWPVAQGALGATTPGKGGRIVGASFSGRPTPDASIDQATIVEGRWWSAPGEAVLDDDTARRLGKGVGDTVSAYGPPTDPYVKGDPTAEGTAASRDLTVVGIAASVSTPDVTAWLSPTDLAALLPAAISADQEMLYRVSPSASATDLASATAAIVAPLRGDAVQGSQTYLEIQSGVDRLADLYVPVLLAFALFALLAAAFLIANVVAGVVLTNERDIGVMKAVGYTPTQVTAILGGQVLVPAAIGTATGVIIGTVASQPVVKDTTASFGLPPASAFSATVVVAVAIAALATCGLAALVPAYRAGRISPVEAMTRGTAPSRRPGGGRLRRAGLGLPVALPLRLGISAGLAHPVRATMLFGALVVGVAAATFAVGLDRSLLRVMEDLNRPTASPVRLEADGGPGPIKATPGGPGDAAPPVDPAAVTAALDSDPTTAHSVAIGETSANLPGMAAMPFVGYDGDASWLGYSLIAGRWFSGPGEVVAPTNVFTRSGLRLGDTTTITHDGRSVQVTLVGEIFDTPRESDDSLVLRGTWSDLAALDPAVEPDRWEAQPVAGVDPETLRSSLNDAIHGNVQVWLEGDSSSDASFLLFLTVVGVMGLVLVAMSLGGVFDTVLLETRQRAREVAVLKAVGLTPAQVVGMVVATVIPVGLLAGVIGVPIGMLAQHVVLEHMGQVAAKTRIPAEVYDVFPLLVLVGLGLLGVGIGALGAYLPAQRAARAGIAPVLAAE